MPSDVIIEARAVSKSFGGVRAVTDCSLTVARGSITGLIGPNGAGKTTLFDMIAGTRKPDSGRIIFDGEDVTGLKPHELFARGLLRTFQIAREFSNMTAIENLMMVPPRQPGENLFDVWVRPGQVNQIEANVRTQGRRGYPLRRPFRRPQRACRQSVGRPEEAPRAWPNDDGGRKGGAA